MSVHDGHRQRLKERFRKEGLDHFEEIHVLELLLFYCVPRQDTNVLAHRLIEHFGSFVRVLSASPEELEQVPGVSEGISTFLSLRAAVEGYYKVKKAQEKEDKITCAEDMCAYMRGFFHANRNEVVYLLCMDGKKKVLSCSLVGEGSVNSASVPIRRIVEMALKSNATFAVLAHNHPSGLAIPSKDDVNTTHRLAQALDGVDIILADHLIYTEDDCVSMTQSRYFQPLVQCDF